MFLWLDKVIMWNLSTRLKIYHGTGGYFIKLLQLTCHLAFFLVYVSEYSKTRPSHHFSDQHFLVDLEIWRPTQI